ncbi:protein DENND6A [Condylostylus longicornis]|uniref:protein DENND6A n=1 Tax=Condylostylus longicornis TaxID=2530218 RepID=UPI00244E17B7|nr:protein DENND6A [Condylostylus longicornis]
MDDNVSTICSNILSTTTFDKSTENALITSDTNQINSNDNVECANCGIVMSSENIQNYNLDNDNPEIENDNNKYILLGNNKTFSVQEQQKDLFNNRFSEWIHCMCVVTFDLELGQAMEEIYPKNSILSEQEIMNICYLAFPDSNSSCMGDTQYHVRLRLSCDNIDSLPLNPIQQKFNAQCKPIQRPDLAHYWGFVYFRQKKDKTIPRGYFQKSFIILTRLPFFNLFNEIVSAIAPRYFNDGKKVLEIVYDQINQWPSLQAGESYNLNLLGTIYQTDIPKSNSKTHNNRNKNNSYVKTLNSKNNYNNISPSTYDNNIDKSNDSIIINNDKYDDVKEINKNLGNLCKKCKNNEKQKNNNYVTKFIGPTLPPKVLTSVHEIDIFRSLSIYISSIYTLWELVLIAEPIVVMGSSPADCSHMVQSLISLIYPLCYLAESRPYFTIHDSEFREFTSPSTNFSDININSGGSIGNNDTSHSKTNNSHSMPPSIILGVTNPFFGKLLQHWPNMIKLPDNSQQMYSIIPKFSFGCNSNSLASHETNNSLSNIEYLSNPSKIKVKNPDLLKNFSSCNSGINNISTSNTNLLNIVTGNSDGSNAPGLYTKYKPFLKKDKTFIKTIQNGVKTKRPEQVQTLLLRQHFLELTESFTIPLERYMASLLPLQKDISPFKAAPNPNEFKQDEFLATLEQSGPHLTSSLKGNWKGLYIKFFKSPNFKGWYECRYKELKQTLQELQLKALSDADLNQWAQGKQEVEIIDMILKLKQKLKLCSETQSYNEDVLNSPTRIQLTKQIENITQSLPDDLKLIIQKST